MQELEYETEIAAPASRVWRALTDPVWFRRWAGEFAPGSRLSGSWGVGEEIRFLTLEGSGMVTRIRALERERLLEFEVIGVVAGGKAEFESADALAWKGGRESHRLVDVGGRCRLTTRVDVPVSYLGHMQEAWPRALAALKELAELGPGPVPE